MKQSFKIILDEVYSKIDIKYLHKIIYITGVLTDLNCQKQLFMVVKIKSTKK